MRLFLTFLVSFCFSLNLLAQTPFYQKKSTYQYCFKINADTAYQYSKEYDIPMDSYVNKTPDYIFQYNTDVKDSLPNGMYIVVKLTDLDIEAKLFIQSEISPHVYNNKNRMLLQVRNMQGDLMNAALRLNTKNIAYNNTLNGFEINDRKLNEKILFISTANDTTLYEIEKLDKDDYKAPKPYLVQKWRRFKYTKIGKVVMWLPERIMSIWNYKYKTKRYRNNKNAQGYIIFNQPKYKLGDTVRWKAFLVNQKGKTINKKLKLRINYYDKRTTIVKDIESMRSKSDGNYYGTFPLADSLPNDTWVTVQLTTSDNKIVKSGRFKIEDYVLDEVTNYKMTANKTVVFKGDTIIVTMSAKDANNLNILDGKVAVSLTRKEVKNIFDSTSYIPDTLFLEKKELSTTQETIIKIPTSGFANVDMNLELKAVFSNSNNEQHPRIEQIQYASKKTWIKVTEREDSLYVEYIENNQSKKINGFCEVNDRLYRIVFPHSLKLNHLVEDYQFYVYDSMTKKLTYEDFEPRADIRNISFIRISTTDTAGFMLSNPKKLPVQYSLFKKGRLYKKGFFETEKFVWQKKMQEKEVYELEYKINTNYNNTYEEVIEKQTIALIQHVLQLKVSNNDYVTPGQKDQVTISVTDYKNRPVNNVNLTAVSYNKQFSKDVRIPYLPSLKRYKSRQPLIYKKYTIDEAYSRKLRTAGTEKMWIEKLQEENNPYYQFLSVDSVKVNRFATKDSITQLSVSLLSNGTPIDPLLIYIDRVLVYYKGASIKVPLSFMAREGLRNVWIRTNNKLYKFNYLNIRAKRKNDFYFNINYLPAKNYTIEEMPEKLTDNELNELNQTMICLEPFQDHGYSWLWQNDKVYQLQTYYSNYLLGPFVPYSNISFYKPYDYKNDFIVEPGYKYKISENKIRMEKQLLFDKKYNAKLFPAYMTTLNVYDSVRPHPMVYLEKPESINKPFIADISLYNSKTFDNDGALYLRLPKDTLIDFYYLKPLDTALKPIIWDGTPTRDFIKSGTYSLNLMTKKGYYLYYDKIVIKENQLLYIDLSNHTFVKENKNFFIISNTNQIVIADSVIQKISTYALPAPNFAMDAEGRRQYVGKIIDYSGNPIAYAAVRVKGTSTGVSANGNGEFSIMANESTELIFSAVGYGTSTVVLSNNQLLTVALAAASQKLEEVVVTGYGAIKKKSMTSSSVTIMAEDVLRKLPGVEFDKMLQGQAAGLTVTAPENMINIRGRASTFGDRDSKPLYVVDGIIVDDISKLDANTFSNVEMLKDAAATAIYGARGADGVVIITTGNQGSALRKSFRDYAIWQPDLITDKKGKASFEVTYPDNITGWELYVLAMDGKKHIGQTSKLVTAYKPLAAQLSMPQFLLQGDSADAVGKIVNYTNDNYTTSIFRNQEKLKEITLNAKASHITKLPLFASPYEKLTILFSMETTTGFKDAEQRSIPVFPVGTYESNGSFWVLGNDTTVTYTSTNQSNEITITAHNNSIDILLAEIDNIKNYSYYCMEQIASKLKALLAEKEIKKHLKQTFKNEKLINKLTDKLLKTQLYDGGWSWWGNGYSNENITYHILSTLKKIKGNSLVDNAVKNGAQFLHSRLGEINADKQVNRLLLLKELEYPYTITEEYISKIKFDSLTLNNQWKMVRLLQKDSLPYTTLLNKLMAKQKSTMLGGVFWEDKNTYWYNDANIITTMAYEVIKADNPNSTLLNNIFQYFLEQKRRGYWMNTFTAINIVETILPDVLAKTSYTTTPELKVQGDTSFTVNQFPFTTTVSKNQQLQFAKKGTGLLYLTAYETYFNQSPDRNEKDFIVNTTLIQKEKVVTQLTANENTKLHLQIQCAKEADYVMIELPILAGCIYQQKNQDYRIVHTEYFKDKVVLFAEKLTVGKHDFYFELQTRYTGNYTLNPAKVSLMYYPIFYGREGLKKVKVGE